MSGHAAEAGDRIPSVAAGFLAEPFTPDDLVRRVAEVLRSEPGGDG